MALVRQAQAAGLPPDFTNRHTLDFGMRFSEIRSEIRIGGGLQEFRTQEAGVLWRERFGADLSLGIKLGNTLLGITGEPLLAGRKLDGHHAGLLANFTFLRTPDLRLHVDAEYIFQDAELSVANELYAVEWHEPNLAIGAVYRLTSGVSLPLGIGYGSLSGQSQLSGAGGFVTSFSETGARGHYGIEFTDDRGGSVGIIARSGLGRGIELHFRRHF